MTFQKSNNWISVTITSMFIWKSEITYTAALPQTVYDTKFELIFIKYAKVTTMVCQPGYTVFLGSRSATKNFIRTNNKIIIACPFNFQTCEGSSSTWVCLTVGQTQHGSRKLFINMRQIIFLQTDLQNIIILHKQRCINITLGHALSSSPN
jgi:hypothetical protein